MALEEELDSLFSAPLNDFVRIRNERAAALRKEGLRAMAAALKEQQKPAVSAWVVNQLARRRPKEIGELIDVGDRLRSAQSAALTGGNRDEFDEARRAERRLIGELLRDAEQVLKESGRGLSAAILDRVNQTLRAASADDEAREHLQKGRFVGDLDAVGFGALAGIKLPAQPPARASAKPKPPKQAERARQGRPGADHARRRQAIEQARTVVTEAQQRERELRKRLKEAEREATQAKKAAERAVEEFEFLRGGAEAAKAATAAAEGALTTLRGASAQSTREPSP